jgi:biopolymer transport protein TolR
MKKETRPRACPASPSINVTPLIDVLLVLLIIFMVIQPQREQKLPVRAPREPAPNSEPAPETLMLTVSAEWRLALNRKAIELQELVPLLTNLMSQRPPEARTLLIKGPSHSSYKSVVSLIDLAKGAGVTTIGLISD